MDQNAIDRGQRAQMLLDDSVLIEALDAIERDVVQEWMKCPARDKDGKEALWLMMKTAQKFREALRGYVETGRFEASKFKRHEEPAGIARLWNRAA